VKAVGISALTVPLNLKNSGHPQINTKRGQLNAV